MFEKARLKLTFWYLLIIMIVSLSFSAVIYRGATNEFERSLDTIERRLRLRQFGLLPPEGRELVFIQDLIDTRNKIVLLLLYTNGTIFVLSIVAGNFLAGKTLDPIEKTLNKQKRFVADASHELKTPLTSLQTSIEVSLRDKKLGIKDARETLSEALVDINQLNTLTENLLTLARSDSVSPAIKKVDVGRVAQRIDKRFQPIAKSKGVRLTSKTAKDYLSINESDLEKLFSVLIDNAIKYTDKGGQVEFITYKAKKCIVAKVADTGIGIADEEQSKVFDRFYRAELSRTKNTTNGHGLGLSIAQEIVNRYNGKIMLTSKLGKGSTFIVNFPTSF